jgi:hypothetical protein
LAQARSSVDAQALEERAAAWKPQGGLAHSGDHLVGPFGIEPEEHGPQESAVGEAHGEIADGSGTGRCRGGAGATTHLC